MGMLFAAESIGVVFFSIISQPFYAGSQNHKAALSMFDTMESTRDVANPLLIPRDFVLKCNRLDKLGVAWGVLDGHFIKIIEASILLDSQHCDRKNRRILGEEACGEANWVSNSVLFYHLYKLMTVWRKVWSSECVGEDEVHRSVFVPVELFFGEFSVCLRSPLVGIKDAASEMFFDEDLMTPIVDAVLWLARTWQLMYIDIRPPNLRVCEDGRLRLIDYDDMVLLEDKPCCDFSTLRTMWKNEHVRGVFRQCPMLAELFNVAGNRGMCDVCDIY